jgi:acetyltransferase-like isoleucine patch superfamily enzyme
VSSAAKILLATPLAALLRASAPLAARAGRLWHFARLRSRCPDLHPSAIVLGRVDVQGTARLSLGRDLYLYRDLHMETQDAGQIVVGDGVVLSRGVHIVAFSRVEIGAGSMIGEYSSVRDANHRFGVGDTLRAAGHASAPVRIGRNVWIGRGVTVLPGVTIGDGAVVGANAVVTRDVPARRVVAGVPARALLQEAA